MNKKLFVLLILFCMVFQMGEVSFGEKQITNMPQGGKKFKEAVEITTGNIYYTETSNLPETLANGGQRGWYKFISPESGNYFFYGGNISSRSMGMNVYNQYNEWITGGGNGEIVTYKDDIVFSAMLEQNQVYFIEYFIYIRPEGKSYFAICSPSQHVSPGPSKVKKKATCIEPGYAVSICEVCNKEASREEIPATGHTPGEWEVGTPATCTEPGKVLPMSRTIEICTLENRGRR